MSQNKQIIYFPYTQVERLTKYINLHDVFDQIEIAERLGISSTDLTHYLKRTYHKKYEKKEGFESVCQLDRDIQKFLNEQFIYLPTHEILQPIFLLTSHAQAIVNTLNDCLQCGETRFIQAATGLGKTYTFQYYQRTHDNVYYIDHSLVDGSQKAFISKLYTTLLHKRLSHRLTVNQAYKQLIGGIQEINGVLIIEEIRFLKAKTLDLLCSFCQESQLGILLSDCDLQADSPDYYEKIAYQTHSKFKKYIHGKLSTLSFPVMLGDVALFTHYHGITNSNITEWLFQKSNTITTRYDWLNDITCYAKFAAQDGADINDLSLYQQLHNMRNGDFNFSDTTQ